MQPVSPSISLRGSLMDFHQSCVMGILNLTPDSFHDGGVWNGTAQAVERAGQMLSEGADILDLGAQSTRPGAQHVGASEEWSRLGPVLDALKQGHPEAIVSVDTFHAEVAQRALDHGADIINDVSGGDADPLMWDVVAKARAPYVMMHMQGVPASMQDAPSYDDVVEDVLQALHTKLFRAYDAGLSDVILDVGFGFGKTVAHNYQLLDALPQFQALGCPILVGVSRKSMISKVLDVPSEGALNGSTALHAWAVDRGAHLLRVHDVVEAREVIQLHKAMRDSRTSSPQ